jgi:hypothetical protein
VALFKRKKLFGAEWGRMFSMDYTVSFQKTTDRVFNLCQGWECEDV